MKSIKSTISFLIIMAMLASCDSFLTTPTSSPTNVMETAISIAFTEVAKTQKAFPSITPSSTPTLVFPVISRNNVSQISEINRWQTEPVLRLIWDENSTKIFMPELFDMVNVYDVASFQSTQISLNAYKQIDPVLFSDETAEQGNCDSFWVRQTNIISPDKSILVTGWSYGHKQPQKTVINLWDLIEKRCILQLPEYDGALTALAFSHSGNYLIFSTDRTTFVWSVKQKEITCQINHAWSAVIYPSERDVMILSGGFDQALGLNLSGVWDIEKCEKIQDYVFEVGCPIFSPNGELLAGIKENHILISDSKTGQLLKELDYSFNAYRDLSFSPDGRYLLSWDYGMVGNEDNKYTFALWAVKP